MCPDFAFEDVTDPSARIGLARKEGLDSSQGQKTSSKGSVTSSAMPPTRCPMFARFSAPASCPAKRAFFRSNAIGLIGLPTLLTRSGEAQVQAEHPAKDEGDEPRA